MSEIYNALSIMSMLLTICGLMGGVWVFRNSISKTANEVQERVISALATEIESMRQRLDDMKEENIRLSLTIDTICTALKGRGLIISIDGDMVSIRDNTGRSTSKRIQGEH